MWSEFVSDTTFTLVVSIYSPSEKIDLDFSQTLKIAEDTTLIDRNIPQSLKNMLA
jgi:hypothetical protein